MNNYSNLDLKFYAKKNRVLEKDVANELGIGYSTLITIWLRNPMDESHKTKFKRAVDSIVAKRNHKNLNPENKGMSK